MFGDRNTSRRSRALAGALFVVVGAAAGCAAPAAKEGLDEVQQLSLRIDAIQQHIDASKAQVDASVAALKALARFDFQDDPADTYEDFVATVDGSTMHVAELRASVAAMREIAEPLFQKWEANLETITSPTMREQSKQRQAETRARYDAIVTSAEAAQTAFDSFNRALGDHVAYLRYDFNASSLAVLQGEVGKIEQSAALLDGQLQSCRTAARVYVEAAALPTAAPAQPAKADAGAR
jgi:hypothetical protein